MEQDPIISFKEALIEHKILTEDEFEEIDKEQKEIVLAAMKFAEESPWPDPITLEQGVFAPESEKMQENNGHSNRRNPGSSPPGYGRGDDARLRPFSSWAKKWPNIMALIK